MSKTFLLMNDMPKHCSACDLCVEPLLGFRCAGYPGQKPIACDVSKEKPEWCPLHNLPSKVNLAEEIEKSKSEDCYDDNYDADKPYMEGYVAGYNECLHQILEGGIENG